ncbi:12380_t:CDS:2, partial [Dentiscutata erythropus]
KYDIVSINYKKITVTALTKMSFWKEALAMNLSKGITTVMSPSRRCKSSFQTLAAGVQYNGQGITVVMSPSRRCKA